MAEYDEDAHDLMWTTTNALNAGGWTNQSKVKALLQLASEGASGICFRGETSIMNTWMRHAPDSFLVDVLNAWPIEVATKVCNFDGQDPLDQSTTFMKVAGQGRSTIVQTMMERGANLYKTDEDGNGVMYYAAAGGNLPTIDVLLQGGVDIDGANHSMRTPFMELCLRGEGYGTPQSLEGLLERGALLHWKDMNERTARELARKSNYQEALSIIDKWVLSKEVNQSNTAKSMRVM